MSTKADLEEILATSIYDRLSNPDTIASDVLLAAGQVLLGHDHVDVVAFEKAIGRKTIRLDALISSLPTDTQEAITKRAEELKSFIPENVEVADVDESKWQPGQPLPDGEYEVAVIYEGQDNVMVTSKGNSVSDVIEVVKTKFALCDTVDLGNEWQKAKRYVIRPI